MVESRPTQLVVLGNVPHYDNSINNSHRKADPRKVILAYYTCQAGLSGIGLNMLGWILQLQAEEHS
jgi:hypothetical protein